MILSIIVYLRGFGVLGFWGFGDDYFDANSLSFTKKPKLKITSSNLLNIYNETVKQNSYKSLLIERSQHYCSNKEYVQKITKLLNQDKNEWAFSHPCILSNIDYEISLVNSMENYMDFIMDIDENNLGENEKEDENPITPIERAKSSIGCYNNKSELKIKLKSIKRKPFQLSLYISTISPTERLDKSKYHDP